MEKKSPIGWIVQGCSLPQIGSVNEQSLVSGNKTYLSGSVVCVDLEILLLSDPIFSTIKTKIAINSDLDFNSFFSLKFGKK